MKIKQVGLFLVLGLVSVVVAGITGCATGPNTSNRKNSPTYYKPTWSGDDHDQPVYTSPATTPAATNLSTEKSPP